MTQPLPPDPAEPLDLDVAEAALYEASGTIDNPDAPYSWAALQAMRTAEALLAEVKRLRGLAQPDAPYAGRSDLVAVPHGALLALWRMYQAWTYLVCTVEPPAELLAAGYASLITGDDDRTMEEACDAVTLWEDMLGGIVNPSGETAGHYTVYPDGAVVRNVDIPQPPPVVQPGGPLTRHGADAALAEAGPVALVDEVGRPVGEPTRQWQEWQVVYTTFERETIVWAGGHTDRAEACESLARCESVWGAHDPRLQTRHAAWWDNGTTMMSGWEDER